MSVANRWATFASENLTMAEAAHELRLWNQVCLRAQQAAAHSLRAFLAVRHRPIPQVKHLSELLSLCVEADAELVRWEDECYALDKFLIPLSYPDAIPSSQMENLPTEQEASQALTIVRSLRDALHLPDPT